MARLNDLVHVPLLGAQRHVRAREIGELHAEIQLGSAFAPARHIKCPSPPAACTTHRAAPPMARREARVQLVVDQRPPWLLGRNRVPAQRAIPHVEGREGFGAHAGAIPHVVGFGAHAVPRSCRSKWRHCGRRRP